MKLEGASFVNSPFCKGIGFAKEGASMDIAKIELTGRYPESGWVVNEVSYEMAYVMNGSGKLINRDGESFEVREGDVVSIDPGKQYAWDGMMTLIVPCTPPFDPNKHKHVEEN